MNRRKCYYMFTSMLTKPYFVFIATFTCVMTILVLSTDLKGRHYKFFNATNVWDFENLRQESPYLVQIIRNEYLELPPMGLRSRNRTSVRPLVGITKLFRRKKGGIFIECGAYNGGVNGGTEWLETVLEWKGLLTQPHPGDYNELRKKSRRRSHTANVCISPIKYPKHASFKNSSLNYETSTNSTLTTVPCFPLYSLMLAFNQTKIDLLVLNLLSAELQILRTIPFDKTKIRVINIINSENDVCCDPNVISLLESHGYEQNSSCPTDHSHCFFSCVSGHPYCPSL